MEPPSAPHTARDTYDNALVLQNSADAIQRRNEQSSIRQPGRPEWIDLAALGQVLRHHGNGVIDNQNWQEAKKERRQELLLGHHDRERSSQQYHEEATD